MTRSPLFWIAVGAAGYWGVQRYRGKSRAKAG
jgi:hypothetical protein